MPNKWIQHTKDYAKKNNMSYRDAIKDSKCKSSYQRKIKKGKGFKETFQTIYLCIDIMFLMCYVYNDYLC